LAGAGTTGTLNLSATAEADGNSTCLNDNRYLAPAVRILEHLLEAMEIIEHIDISEGNFTAGKILTGPRSIRSKVLTVN